MRGPNYENNLADMDAAPAAAMALKHKDVIVGFKTAHYAGPEWTPVEHAVEAGTIARMPIMSISATTGRSAHRACSGPRNYGRATSTRIVIPGCGTSRPPKAT